MFIEEKRVFHLLVLFYSTHINKIRRRKVSVYDSAIIIAKEKKN